MEEEKFINILIEKAEKIGVDISIEKAKRFYAYMKIMLEWNEKINLTAITEENEIILKHFIDSISINKHIKNSNKIIDVGTGAGFPGIPLKIINDDIDFILMDSLNKRIKFLEEVKEKLELKKIELVHARAEELGKDIKYRAKVDVAVSRAVSNLRVLVEYMLPLVKKNGTCICMKGPNLLEEIEDAKNAIGKLGGKIEKIENIMLQGNEIERNIVIIRKIEETPNKYPRKPGIPMKQPL